MVKVAINGFGRIGRMVLRAGINRDDIEFVACNDLTDKETLAHLFKHDSAHGAFTGSVEVSDTGLYIDGKHIQVLAQKDPAQLPWAQLGIDVVIESTGIFKDEKGLQKHIYAGAKKVVLCAPAKGDGVKTIVIGVNEHTYDPEKDHLISNASCTTNCLAPLAKVLDDNFGIVRGYMTTVHAYTGDQRIQDAPHRDLRRARAAAFNIIPTSTGAAKAVGLVLPHLQGKLDGMAIRVPVIDGSITDLVVELKKEVTTNEINELLHNVSQHHLQGIIEYREDQPVSSDIINNSHSSIFDAKLTLTQGNMVKVCSWYDNEWGYSNRVVELVSHIAR